MNGASIQINNQAGAQAAKDAAAAATEQAGTARNVQTKVTGKTHSVVYHNGQVTSSTSAAVGKGTNAPITQVDAPSVAENSSAVTGKSSMGRALSGNELQPNSVVKIGTMEGTVSGLTAAGLIQKTAAGGYEYTAKAKAFGHKVDGAQPAAPQQPQEPRQSQPQEQQQQQEAADSKPVPLDEEGEGLLQEFKSAVPGDVLVNGISRVITSGELSDTDIATVAKHFNISPEEARTKATAFQESFTRQAHQAVGPESHAIFDWARTTAPAALQEAMHDHVHSGSLAGYQNIANNYLQNLDTINPAAILDSEDGKKLNARLESNGRISIDTPRGRMGWSSWVRIAPNKPNFFKR